MTTSTDWAVGGGFPILDATLPLTPPSGMAVPAGLADRAELAWATAETKVRSLVARHPDRFPLYTQNGAWAVGSEAWTNWCEGFLGGQLWMLARRTEDADLTALAQRYSKLIAPRTNDRTVHDLGFLFWPTWKRWYDLVGDPAYDAVVIRAGRTLATRFNEKGRFLRSFLAADSLFIDIMMNVGIIFYAAQRTRDPELARIATEHSLTTRRTLVRGDGSAAHEGIFDLETGAFLRQTTQQGYRNDSSWARGQAWALYGFGTAYRYTGDRRFLASAQHCADFYIARTGDDLIPPNDWDEPEPTHRYESSAAAVAAGGLWQLAGLVRDEQLARSYGEYALRILARLTEPEFLASGDPGWEGVLKHATYHERKGLGVDESAMWGDYWFLDALEAIESGIELHPTPAGDLVTSGTVADR
jgi:unsaturated chondroitin disaccharide hydrolase